MRSPVVVTETMTATGWDVRVSRPLTLDEILAANAQFGPLDLDLVGKAMADSDRRTFERERLVSLIIDVGMMRRDVALDVADAILAKWPLLDKAEIPVRNHGYKIDIENLRSKLATVHRLMCEASAHLAKTSKGDDKDVDAAASTVALAIRLGA